MRRYLNALLRIGQANSRELGPERQTRLILDELLESVGAERAFLFMRGENQAALTLRAARRSGGFDLAFDEAYDRALVDQVYGTGQSQRGVAADSRLLAGGGDRACLIVALVLREKAVGVLYLDRADLAGEFHPEDAALLQALANQVPIALELAGALRERDRLEQNLRQAQKMEAIGRLAGGIAHDFNNILGAIQMAAHSLESVAEESDEVQEDIKDIQDSARRGAELTRQLLTFSRGKAILPRRIVLGELVEELSPMLRRIVRAPVRIELTVEPQPVATMADPSQIERVLVNLCQNASDAMPNGGTLGLRVGRPSFALEEPISAHVKRGESYALLVVSDTGSGMSEQVRARLFEPFFTTKAGQRGTGLGLANVYAIVQQCGGHIEVTSEDGAGSSFWIYLPRCDNAVDSGLERITIEPSLEADDLGRGNVLVVDDDEQTRHEIAALLERAGYQVLAAADGENALRDVDAYDGLLDLAVIDLRMPGMDGPQLAASLLERDPDVKLLFISGHDSEELQARGLLDRDASFLAKPFTAEALLLRIQASLRSPPLAAVSERAS
jgi:signal transduction histidine kinase/CheY-like chemotaxis protein